MGRPLQITAGLMRRHAEALPTHEYFRPSGCGATPAAGGAVEPFGPPLLVAVGGRAPHISSMRMGRLPGMTSGDLPGRD
jgi:hypothetical protein